MLTEESIAALRSVTASWRRCDASIGFVPTMGNLHAGHLSLVEQARRQTDRIVVSVFVNPLQFGPDEDFERYPRTLEADTEKLRSAGVDLLFLPDVSEIYPASNRPATYVEVPDLSDDLCGRFRPGHFRGVATVVCKLLNIVQPDQMLLGEKDFQQLTLLRQMVSDLDLPVRVVAGPTVREADGLALSSRNGYLSPGERERAPELYRCLSQVAATIASGETSLEAAEAQARTRLENQGFLVDYVSVRRRSDLAQPESGDRELIVLAAAWAGSTRLIDNKRIDL
jgi:pantoate--beta-alanine ligase